MAQMALALPVACMAPSLSQRAPVTWRLARVAQVALLLTFLCPVALSLPPLCPLAWTTCDQVRPLALGPVCQMHQRILPSCALVRGIFLAGLSQRQLWWLVMGLQMCWQCRKRILPRSPWKLPILLRAALGFICTMAGQLSLALAPSMVAPAVSAFCADGGWLCCLLLRPPRPGVGWMLCAGCMECAWLLGKGSL